MTEQAKPLPKYRCHKIVEAVKIAQINPVSAAESNRGVSGAWIVPAEEGIASFFVTFSYLQRHQPNVGGYFVRYEGDNYESWSPAKAFEEGYTLIEECEAPAPGDAVYGWPMVTIYCGGCGHALWMLFYPLIDHRRAPCYSCQNEYCLRRGKLYEISTAHAVVLREAAKPMP